MIFLLFGPKRGFNISENCTIQSKRTINQKIPTKNFNQFLQEVKKILFLY